MGGADPARVSALDTGRVERVPNHSLVLFGNSVARERAESAEQADRDRRRKTVRFIGIALGPWVRWTWKDQGRSVTP